MNSRTENLWQIVGSVAALLGVIVTVSIFYLTQRGEARQIGAILIGTTKLLNFEVGKAASDLHLTYNNRQINNVLITRVRIKNSGRHAIKSSDIEDPIHIQFKDVEEIISSSVVNPIPSNLKITTKIDKDKVVLEKTLINSGDEFVVEITSIPQENYQASVVDVSGRIAGIKQVNFQAEESERRFSNELLAGAVTAILGAVLSVFFSFVSQAGLKKVSRARRLLEKLAELEKEK